MSLQRREREGGGTQRENARLLLPRSRPRSGSRTVALLCQTFSSGDLLLMHLQFCVWWLLKRVIPPFKFIKLIHSCLSKCVYVFVVLSSLPLFPLCSCKPFFLVDRFFYYCHSYSSSRSFSFTSSMTLDSFSVSTRPPANIYIFVSLFPSLVSLPLLSTSLSVLPLPHMLQASPHGISEEI